MAVELDFNTLAGTYNYTLISTNATTTIKSLPGVFAGVYVTNAGTSWAATVYDSLTGSGTVVLVQATLALGNYTPVSGCGIITQIGLTIVTSGTTAGTLLILWR